VETYTYTITIVEGNDEWWEEMNRLPMPQRVERIREVLVDELYAYDPVITNMTTFQGELDL
jgi:hypothetical protein